MLILILIDVQYLHNLGFSFAKDSNGQNHPSSPPRKISYPPLWGFPPHAAPPLFTPY